MKKYTCPCCGYKTLYEEPTGTYDICDNCYWEDDIVMNENPDYMVHPKNYLLIGLERGNMKRTLYGNQFGNKKQHPMKTN